jgi:23S rRNA (cytosine1962-C5)-methyltransferase
MVSGIVTLRPGRERSVRRRHPWIFSGAVAHVDGRPAPGDSVQVMTADGEVLGIGAYSPVSQIRVRMWTFVDDRHHPSHRPEVVDAEFVTRRVVAAAERRRRVFVDADTDAARLVFSEADGVPGLVADRYGDTVVMQLTTAGAERWRDTIADALFGVDGVTSVYERSDADTREREGLDARVGVVRGEAPSADLVVRERGVRYHVDVAAGHKTGFYLDQRDARAAVAGIAAGARVLNAFSYTGAFGVVATLHGATEVTSIDSSGPALDVARRNAATNGVEPGELIEADAFTALRGLRDRARSYDLILLDPPKLALSDQHLDRASRAYKDLNLLAVKLLAPGGTLLTFSCSGAMTAELFQKVVAGAALDARRSVRIVGRLHQPDDHPVPLTFPEADYLKGLVLRAD